MPPFVAAINKYEELYGNTIVPPDEPSMTQLRGSLDAVWVMVAPPTTAEEYEKEVPLSSVDAVAFHKFLQKEELDTDSDFLVIPCLVYGTRCKKWSTAPIKEYVEWLAQQKEIRGFVCIGPDAFKHIFGRGAKPLMSSLIGCPMNMSVTQYKPVVVFPSIKGLHIPLAIRRQRSREAYFQIRESEWIQKQCHVAINALKKVWTA